jgi:hypothetical protein
MFFVALAQAANSGIESVTMAARAGKYFDIARAPSHNFQDPYYLSPVTGREQMEITMKRIVMISLGLLVAVGCSSAKIHGDKKVVASGGARPAWVADVQKQGQKELAKFLDQESNPPQYYYVVSQATVDNEQLLPNCYDFARTGSANDFARGIVEEVKSTTASSMDTGTSSHYAEIVAATRAKVVGAQILGKHWETIEDKDGNTNTTCWVIAGVPMKNYEALKKYAEQAVRDSSSKGAKRTKKAVQKKQDQQDQDEAPAADDAAE